MFWIVKNLQISNEGPSNKSFFFSHWVATQNSWINHLHLVSIIPKECIVLYSLNQTNIRLGIICNLNGPSSTTYILETFFQWVQIFYTSIFVFFLSMLLLLWGEGDLIPHTPNKSENYNILFLSLSLSLSAYLSQHITTPNLLKFNKVNPVESTHSIAFTLRPISSLIVRVTTLASQYTQPRPKPTSAYHSMYSQAVENSKADCFQHFGDVGSLGSETSHVPRTYSQHILPLLCWHERVSPV